MSPSTVLAELAAELRGRSVLVTGATGMIGRRLSDVLNQVGGIRVITLGRADVTTESRVQTLRRYADLTKPATLIGCCKGVNLVFHCAGRAHSFAETEQERELHYQVNTVGTQHLLADAIRCGVRRFVYLSTVKTMGEGTEGCLDETSECRPQTAYGETKLQAERTILSSVCARQIEGVILRLPLVYGPEPRGNLARLIMAAQRPLFPAPPRIHNRRSLVHVDDVVQAVLLAAVRSEANGKIYLVTDGKTYSTREIYDLICRGLGERSARWTLPVGMLRLMAPIVDMLERLVGRSLPLGSNALSKLIGSACYDTGLIARELGYRPARTLEDAVGEMIHTRVVS